ncbi:CheW domain-containing protein [Pseudomonas sp.]|uniref:CheW domain-containing protein n=1 Tax=Pseudomonas sp. TaxID=306 RepID=UPI0019E03FA4|nr:CheW domain-containing protein [Pseudomonas sp.]MBF0674583.1 CheW domain-containing protein [Pseudomonas sp.]MBF0675925.1 CheW domain-containing protein [Pseudomonas sp.]
MQEISTRVVTLSAPQQALQSYLDELLQDAALELEQSQVSEDEFQAAVREELQRDRQTPQRTPSVAAKVVAPVEMPVAVPVAPVASVAPIAPPAERSAPVVPPVAKAAPVAPASVTPAVQPPVAATPAPVTAPPSPPLIQAARPNWGEEPFECLLFDVAGLTLAVPLVCLGTVHSLQGQELTPIFGQPDWFLGMLSTHSGNLKVLDTARWVMPERYRDEFRDHLKFVITIQGYDWGLAVHQVDRSIHLHPGQVKWRTQRTQRPWLAGTVIEHMCALLDVAALADLIRSGAHTRKS